MCRIGSIKSKTPVPPSMALNLMLPQQEGHDNSGFAMVMQDLEGVFSHYKDKPLLSLACTPEGVQLVNDYMVGGAVYFRGPVGQLPKDVRLNPLDDEDIAWLDAGLDDFLMAIDQPSLRSELCDWSQWQKITPLPFEERGQKEVVSLGQFRSKEWIPSGIFSDVAPDDFMVNGLVARGDYRLRVPMLPYKLAAQLAWIVPATH